MKKAMRNFRNLFKNHKNYYKNICSGEGIVEGIPIMEIDSNMEFSDDNEIKRKNLDLLDQVLKKSEN